MTGTHAAAGWQRILALAAAVGFVEAALFGALAPLLPVFEADLELNKVEAGVLTAAYAFGAFAGAIPSIWLTRRLGVAATVVAGLVLLGVSSVVFAFPETGAVVFLARFGQGFGSAFAYTGALAWLTTVVPWDRRGEAIGFAFAAAFSGALLGPMLGVAADWLGTAPVFLGVAVVAFALVVVALVLPRPSAHLLPTEGLRYLALEPSLRLAFLLIALTGLLLGMLGVLAPLRLSELGLSVLAIGVVLALGGVLQALVNPLVGRLADRRGREAPLRVGLLLAAVTSALLILDRRAALYALVVVFASVAYAMLWTPATALLSDVIERRGFDQAAGFGLMGAAWPPGFAIGAAVGGGLAAATSDAASYLLAAGACLLALPLLRRLGTEDGARL